MDENYRILIVDDEEDLCEILRFNLSGEGYRTEVAYSAEEALDKLAQEEFSLILLDVMMEGMSGFNMAEKLRKDMHSDIPIIFLTAKDTENDMLTGFSIGADDYIAKPFSVKEVQARVKAVLRRYVAEKSKEDTSGKDISGEGEIIKFDNLVIDQLSKNVTVDGEPVKLTRKEFEILHLLASAPGRVFSREDILHRIWTDDVYVLERTVDVHITRLRKKLGSFGKRITNRSNYGYTIE